MLTKKKTIIASLAVVIVIGVAGVVVWQQFYRPKRVIGPVGIIDDVGRNVVITEYPPERIVSLAPSCTEILFALGLGSRVVGVDEYSDYPPEAQERVETGNLTTVGSFATISIEAVVGLEPDLVLATGGVQRPAVEGLEGLGILVVVLYPTNIDGILSDILLVGKITGQMDEAEALVTDMRKKIQEIADKTRNLPRPRVYVEYFFDGGYWSYGSESLVNELIYEAGGTNIFAGFAGKYISTSTEEVIKANPEIIVISKGEMAKACGLSPEVFKERSVWNEIYAVQNDQIYEIDEDLLVRAGPRIVDGLEALARVMHPESFE
ncbi:MAG: ABC transporter substrate-binding protein [Candidatus Bathyarchaeia archaeon]